ncbi:DUF2282 domain-containing protein [Vibrio chagasii]|nr:DUF2282 domain-containing protein [Vibrio chagasii]
MPFLHQHQREAAAKEKCYGVSKLAKMTVQLNKFMCWYSKEDNQSDAFVVVPKGLCGKLTGGSTQSS